MLWGMGPDIPVTMGTLCPTTGPRVSMARGSRPADTQTAIIIVNWFQVKDELTRRRWSNMREWRNNGRGDKNTIWETRDVCPGWFWNSARLPEQISYQQHVKYVSLLKSSSSNWFHFILVLKQPNTHITHLPGLASELWPPILNPLSLIWRQLFWEGFHRV